MFCEFPDASRLSRRWLLDHAATTRSTIFSSHFPGSSVGRVTRVADGFAWHAV
jgi:hypothetical protein